MAIDTDWFKDRIAKSGNSLRSLAPKLKNKQGRPMDVHSLSKLINGERDMTVHDAVQFAKAFEVDVREIIKRAGF